MTKKLVRVEFATSSLEEEEAIFDAFKSAFPSLATVPFEDVVSVLGNDFLDISDAIDVSSVDGKWPAKASLRIERTRNYERREARITPHCGDRHFILRNYAPHVVCDYSERPSAYAARQVIEIVNNCRTWTRDGQVARLHNNPEWVEESDES